MSTLTFTVKPRGHILLNDMHTKFERTGMKNLKGKSLGTTVSKKKETPYSKALSKRC